MLTPCKVAEVLDTGLYAPKDIYNMDECGFDLSSSRRTRRVGPRGSSIKAQASLASSTHITVVACISTFDAPVPPFILYEGKYFMEDWTKAHNPTPAQKATVTESGFSNTGMTIRWLNEVFDPATRDRAAGSPRLLFLDGPIIHTSVEFLEACWAANIVCVILPANLSAVFQPLDVDFFNHVKLAYHTQVDKYQMGSGHVSVPKGFFYRWHQRAWAKAATLRQIRTAWAKARLYPRREVTVGLTEAIPTDTDHQLVPKTPRCNRTLRALDQRLQSGEISPTSSARKVRKGLEDALAHMVVLERDIEWRKASDEQDREARSQGKRTRYPQGQLFDQLYHDEHAEELAERRGAEEGRKRKRKAKARPVPHAESSNSAQRRGEAMPTEDESIAWLASMADEL